MGRKKSKTKELRPLQKSSSSAIQATKSSTQIQEDVEEQEAEIHITSMWDEHPYEEEEEEAADQSMEFQPGRGSAESFCDDAAGSPRNDEADSSDLMEDLVRSAWQNSTHDYDTLVPMEEAERHHRSQSGYRP
jgi:hypothetical protein